LFLDAVVVKGLNYQYHPAGPLILDNIDFNIKRGELVVVTGLSGCGKSSLCLCVSGAVRYQRYGSMSGEIILNGRNSRDIKGAQLALEVGMVFQDPDTQLFSPTVEDEIAFAPENLCLPPERIRAKVDYAVDILGLAD
jgi:energy-coupling factor transport system ATP-binding protein